NATTSAHNAGSVDIVVTNPNTTSATRTNGFSYVLPNITSISPNTGTTNGGTRISINGKGFSQCVKVTVGGHRQQASAPPIHLSRLLPQPMPPALLMSWL